MFRSNYVEKVPIKHICTKPIWRKSRRRKQSIARRSIAESLIEIIDIPPRSRKQSQKIIDVRELEDLEFEVLEPELQLESIYSYLPSPLHPEKSIGSRDYGDRTLRRLSDQTENNLERSIIVEEKVYIPPEPQWQEIETTEIKALVRKSESPSPEPIEGGSKCFLNIAERSPDAEITTFPGLSKSRDFTSSLSIDIGEGSRGGSIPPPPLPPPPGFLTSGLYPSRPRALPPLGLSGLSPPPPPPPPPPLPQKESELLSIFANNILERRRPFSGRDSYLRTSSDDTEKTTPRYRRSISYGGEKLPAEEKPLHLRINASSSSSSSLSSDDEWAVSVSDNSTDYLDDYEDLLAAAYEGEYKNFEKLLRESTDEYQRLPKALNHIHLMLIKHINFPPEDNCDIRKCYEVLINSKHYEQVDVNDTDEDGHTALYYASNTESHDIIRNLLDRGAYLSAVDPESKRLNVEFIPQHILEQHFDSCLELTVKDCKRKFRFDYSSLTSYENNDISALGKMAEVSYLKQLLTHPLVASYVFLNWEELKTVYYCRTVWAAIFTFLPFIIIFSSVEVLIALTIFAIGHTIADVYINIYRGDSWVSTADIVNASSVAIYITKIADGNKLNETSALMFLPMIWQIASLLERFDFCSVHIIMFKIVSENFFKIMLNYFLIFLSLMLSYHLLIYVPQKEELHHNVTSSVFNAILLLPAEYRLEVIQLSPVGCWIFLTIIFVSIILMNLINALALNDTLKALEKAEMLKLISKIKFISVFAKHPKWSNLLDLKSAELNMTKNKICFKKFQRSNETVPKRIQLTWMWMNCLNRCRSILLKREQQLFEQNKLKKLEEENQMLSESIKNGYKDIIKSLRLSNMWTATAILMNADEERRDKLLMEMKKQCKEEFEYPFEGRNKPLEHLLESELLKSFNRSDPSS